MSHATIPTGTSEEGSDGNADTTTVTAQMELPEGEHDVRRMILDDYEKCLCRHDVSFTDLLRLHTMQSQAAMKLTISLNQARKKEVAEKKKAEELGKEMNKMTKGCKDVAKTGEKAKSEDKRQTPDDDENATIKTEALKKSINDIRLKIEELREKKDDIDKRYAEAKARETECDNIESQKQRDENFGQLAQVIVATKKEIFKILRKMNESLAELNQRLKTDYKVQEDPETTDDVRNVLDTILYDVTTMVDGKRRMEVDIEEMKKQIEELEKHTAHAEKMNSFLDREVAKLLAIGNRPEANKVNQKDYNQVIKFVEETFNILIQKLKKQNKDIDDQKDLLKVIERENDRKQKEYDQEMIAKQATLDHIRRQIELTMCQNDALRNELGRAPRSPVASESDTHQQLNELRKIQCESGKQQIATLENQLQRAKNKNEEARKKVGQMTNDINNMDDKLKGKLKELDDLRQQGDQERDSENRKCAQIEKQIIEITKEIDRLQNELQDGQQPSKCQPGDADDLNKAEKEFNEKLKELDEKMKRAEVERTKLVEQMNKMNNECQTLRSQLREEDVRRNDLEDKLGDTRGKINDTEKRVEREREKGYQLEREYRQAQSLEVHQTTLTKIIAGGSQFQSQEQQFNSQQGGGSMQKIENDFQLQICPPSEQDAKRLPSRGRSSSRESTTGSSVNSVDRSSTRPSRKSSFNSSEKTRREETIEWQKKEQTSASAAQADRPSTSGQQRNSSQQGRDLSKDRRSRSQRKDKREKGSSKQRKPRKQSKLRSPSKDGTTKLEVQITPEITVTHQGANENEAKIYDVKGNLVLTVEQETDSSSNVNQPSSNNQSGLNSGGTSSAQSVAGPDSDNR